jgi:hypothetical protein
MFAFNRRIARLSFSFCAVALLALASAAPAFADNTVSLSVTAGQRTAHISDLTLTAVAYSHSTQYQTGTMILSADDSTGSGKGWHVNVQTSDFSYMSGGATGGTAIPDENFEITSTGLVTTTAGQAADVTNGPVAPGSVAGTLDSPVNVLSAQPNYGLGAYQEQISVRLTIPEQYRAGSYQGTLTVDIIQAP